MTRPDAKFPAKGSHRLRRSRAALPGQYYLLTTATFARAPVFQNAEIAQLVLAALRWLDQQGKIRLDAAVVMPDHVHCVAQLSVGSLAGVMQSFKRFSARQINQALQRTGPLWQAQYHDHALRRDEDHREVVRYCLHNPVRVGIVADFHDYPHWWCRWEV